MCPPDSSLLEFEWGRIRWVMNGDVDTRAGITMGVVEIDAGKKNPLHLHPNCDEVLHLLAGTVEHRIGSDVISMTPGDTIFVPADTPHDGRNTGTTTARMVVAYPTGYREMVVLE